jgi:hypothetical protein
MNNSTPNVGSQDPERRNSPVAWESDEDSEVLRQEVAREPVCYFNDTAYSHGTTVRSGTVLLRCDRGLWVPAGSSDPANP